MRDIARYLTCLCVVVLCAIRALQAQDTAELRFFIDFDSLTVYVPGSKNVSLLGVGFEVVVDNERKSYFFEDFDSFAPLRFEAIPAPICLRLERHSNLTPVPLACNGIPTLRQKLASTDVFWYDPLQGATRTLILVQRANQIFICPAGQDTCVMDEFSPVTLTPTPLHFTPSMTPTTPAPLTPTATSLPTLTTAPTYTPIPRITGDCGNGRMWQFSIGQRGLVPLRETTPSTLRAEPGSLTVYGYIYPGNYFTIVEGPICSTWNGMSWWRVRTDDGREGWISEGNREVYWIDPA